jgi:uncharacterized protein YgiM (DUF1202 family)
MSLPMDLYPKKRRLSPVVITVLVVICCLSSTAVAVLYLRNRPSSEVDRSAIVAQTVTAMALSHASPAPAQATPSSSQSSPSPPTPASTPTATSTPLPTPTPTPIPTGLVSVEVLNLRTGPDTTYGVVGQLKKNDRLELLARNEVGTWLRVRAEGGREGWVFAEYIYTTVNIVTLQVATEVPPPNTP